MRWLVRIVIGLAALAVVAAAITNEVARRGAERVLGDLLESRVSVKRLSGLLSGRLRVEGLRVVRRGAWRVVVPEALVEWSPRALLARKVEIARITVRAPRVAATDRAPDLFARVDSEEPAPVTVVIGRIAVSDGRFAVAVGEPGTRSLYGADRVDGEAVPSFRDESWDVAVDHLTLRPRGRPIPPVAAAGTVWGDAGVVTVRAAATLTGVGPADVVAAVRLGRHPTRYRVAVTTPGVDLRPLEPRVPVERVRGRVVLRGRGTNAGERLAYTATLGADVPRAGATRVRLAGHGLGDVHHLRTTVVTDAGLATARGTIALDGPTVDAHVDATGDLKALGRRLDLALGGRTTVSADVRGPLATPRIAGTIDAVDASYAGYAVTRASAAVVVEPQADRVRIEIARLTAEPARGPVWTLAAPTSAILGPSVELAPTTLASADGRVLARGRLGPGAAIDLTLGVEAVDLARLCTTLDAGECTGTVTANARVTGDGPTPRLDAVVRHSLGPEITATGRVPFPWPAGGPAPDLMPLALDVRTGAFDVATLQPLARGSLLQLGGRVDVTLAVTGSLAKPAIDGRLRLTGGRLQPAATRVRYEDVEASLRLVPGAVVVDSITAHADGTFRGSGRMALDGFAPGAIELALTLERLRLVDQPAYQAAASGRLDVTGTGTAPLVSGDLEVSPAAIRPAVLSEQPIAPDPTIEVVGGSVRPPAPGGPDLADAIALDVNVHVGRDVAIRRSDARIDLGGAVHVTKAAHAPLVVHGDVQLVRGWFIFQRRRFTVEPSAVRFAGPPDRPTLDVSATTRAAQYDVTVRLTGTAVAPILTLLSDPPLPESDVLAVLLFGVPASELGRSQQTDLQQQAIGLASSYLAGGLTDSLRETLGLDVFDVTMGEGNQPGEVRVGQYVTDDIFVTLSQEFGTRAGQAASLEYRLRPRVSVRLSTSTNGSSGIDLLWHRRY